MSVSPYPFPCYLGSLSKKQFGENQTLHFVVFTILTGLFVAFIFLRQNIISFLKSIYGRYYSTKAVVQCISLVMVSVVAFLIKYPRFNIHATLRISCIHEEEIKEILTGKQSHLFSFGAFSLLALLISPPHESIALKVSGWLLGLTIETSMEIPSGDVLNLRYMFGTAAYCIFLIFFEARTIWIHSKIEVEIILR